MTWTVWEDVWPLKKAAVSFLHLETLLELLKQSSTDRDIVCVCHSNTSQL